MVRFWVFTINWRSRAVEVVAEICGSEDEAEEFCHSFMLALPADRREDFVKYCTIGVTPVSLDLLATAEQWKRRDGRISSEMALRGE